MSAHVRYVTLPGRPLALGDISSNPEFFKCRLLGSLMQDFVNGNEYLAVWQCLISKKVFWQEIAGDYSNLRLMSAEQEYFGSRWVQGRGLVRSGPELHQVTHDNLHQFCHFVRGWRPDCGMYDAEEREKLVISIRKAFDHAIV